MHDAYRVDKGGKPTFERVRAGLERLQAHGVEYNTLTTLHHANADHPVEVYRFLRDECGSRYMQFIPIIERLPAPRIDVPLSELGLSPGLAQAGAVALLARPPAVPPGGRLRHGPLGDRRSSTARSSSGCSTSGSAGTSARSTSRCSTSPSPTGTASRRRCASTRRCAAPRSRWSTTATSTRATTSSRRTTASATSTRRRWPSSSRPTASGRSGSPSGTRCPRTAGRATCASPATAGAPRTGSSRRRTASPGSTTCAPGTRPSSATSTGRCG